MTEDAKTPEPDATASDGVARDGGVSEQVVPDTAVPETDVPEGAAPDAAVQESVVPEPAVLETPVPESAVAEDAVTDDAVTDDAVPEHVVPKTFAPEEAGPESPSAESTAAEEPVPGIPPLDAPAPETTVSNTTASDTTAPAGAVSAQPANAPAERAQDAGSARTTTAQPRGPKRRNTALTVGVRTLVGLVAVAATGSLVAAAVLMPMGSVARTPEVIVAHPPAGVSTIVCADDFLMLGRDAADAQRVTGAGVFSRIGVGDTDATATPLPIGTDGETGTTALSLESSADAFAATGDVRLAADDAAGYAVAACRPALTESWLAGVDTTTGSSGVITLANPGAVAATVTVTVFGEAGPKVPPGGDGIILPPRTTTALAVSALAGSEPAPVIHVSAAGAQVQASVASTIVRGLVPGGIDVLQPGAAAAPTQVLPGFSVPRAVAGAKSTVVRVLSPEENGTVTVTLIRSGTTEAAMTVDVPVVGGIPQDVPLENVPVGEYDVVVSAEMDIVAAAWQITGTTAADDMAWFASAPAVASSTTIAVAQGTPATLAVFNPSDADASVVVTGQTGSQTIPVPAGAGIRLPVAAGSVTLDPQGTAVHAAVTYGGDELLASSTVWQPAAVSSEVSVTR